MIKGFLALAVVSLVGFSAHASIGDYAGSYAGKFEGAKGTLVIAVNDSTMSASFYGANGFNDILGGACGSTIGQMTDIDMDGAKVDHVTFAFDAGSCSDSVDGRELTIDFGHKNEKVNSARAAIFARTTYTTGHECHSGGNTPICFPTTQSVDLYATGKFKK